MNLYQKIAIATVGVTLGCGVLEANLHPASAATLRYNLTDLGTLGGPYSLAYGINDLGQVVGKSAMVPYGGTNHAFRTAPDSLINGATDDLATVGTTTFAYAINNLGQVAGYIEVGALKNAHAYRTAPNSPINPATDDLGTLGGKDSQALGINNLGQVVGYGGAVSSQTKIEYIHAFRTAPNSPINPATDDLGTLSGLFTSQARAFGINDSGQVVGYGDTKSGAVHAFRTAPNSPINPATDDLGSFINAYGTGYSQAYGINNLGQVVGTSNGHAFRTAPNSPINPATDDLGNLGGSAQAQSINDSGQVVGYSYLTSGGGVRHAFVYDDGIYDLNNVVVNLNGFSYLDIAYGINNLGQITGIGMFSNGQSHAFLATPIAAEPQAVPEPSDSLFSAVAILGLGWLGKKKVACAANSSTDN